MHFGYASGRRVKYPHENLSSALPPGILRVMLLHKTIKIGKYVLVAFGVFILSFVFGVRVSGHDLSGGSNIGLQQVHADAPPGGDGGGGDGDGGGDDDGGDGDGSDGCSGGDGDDGDGDGDGGGGGGGGGGDGGGGGGDGE